MSKRKSVAGLADHVATTELVAHVEALRLANRRNATKDMLHPYKNASPGEIADAVNLMLNELQRYRDDDMASLKSAVRRRSRWLTAVEALTFNFGLFIGPILYFSVTTTAYSALLAALAIVTGIAAALVVARLHLQVAKTLQLRREIIAWSEVLARAPAPHAQQLKSRFVTVAGLCPRPRTSSQRRAVCSALSPM